MLGAQDLVPVDTPPNLGLLTVNALLPADVVIAPVSAEDQLEERTDEGVREQPRLARRRRART